MPLDEIKDIIPSDIHPVGNTDYGRKRTPRERERDLPVVAGMYVRGIPAARILDEINEKYPEERQMTVAAIYNDIRVIRKRWLESTLVDFNELKGKELARLDEVERELWDAWERSKEKRVIMEFTDHTGQVPIRTGDVVDVENSTIRRREETPVGDLEIMKSIVNVINTRCKLLGLMETERYMVDWRMEARAMGWNDRDTDRFYQSIVDKFVDAIKTVEKPDDEIEAEYSMKESENE